MPKVVAFSDTRHGMYGTGSLYDATLPLATSVEDDDGKDEDDRVREGRLEMRRGISLSFSRGKCVLSSAVRLCIIECHI